MVLLRRVDAEPVVNLDIGKRCLPRNYDTLIARLDALDAPADLDPVKNLITSAVKEQQQYFSSLHARRNFEFKPNNALVQSSHGKLIKAYRLLMSAYAVVAVIG